MMSNEDCELENLKLENHKLGKRVEFLKEMVNAASLKLTEEKERRQFAEQEVTNIKKEMRGSMDKIRESGL